MSLVAGVDSSTQSCKVAVIDAASGALVRSGAARHPDGTAVHPQAWWDALRSAVRAAGGIEDVAAISVAAQQHGLVCLDEDGMVVRDALLWNDLRSADAAAQLVAELPGGRQGWATAVGSVPVASFTVAKLRWVAEHEPHTMSRTAAVCLPHDWLTWQLTGSSAIDQLSTDRSDASGTGYWSAASESYRPDLVDLACGALPVLPRVMGASSSPGRLANSSTILGCGAGDNASASLGVAATDGDVLVSLGTSGVACAVSPSWTCDVTGVVAGFADATGRFLPLVCTLNATRVFDAIGSILGVDATTLGQLALSTVPGADGVVVVPYWEGERTPDRPHSTGAVHGLRLSNSTPANLARAAFEGVLCGLADGIDALRGQGVPVRRVMLVGGGARSQAVCRITGTVLGVPVVVPAEREHVARGAARQAAWSLSGAPQPPAWPVMLRSVHNDAAVASVRERYAAVRDLTGSDEGVSGTTPGSG